MAAKIKNTSTLRAYIFKCVRGGVDRKTAWEIWKFVLAPRATKSFFDAEWDACTNGRYYENEVDYSGSIRMRVCNGIA